MIPAGRRPAEPVRVQDGTNFNLQVRRTQVLDDNSGSPTAAVTDSWPAVLTLLTRRIRMRIHPGTVQRFSEQRRVIGRQKGQRCAAGSVRQFDALNFD